jgi:hypothetical protein
VGPELVVDHPRPKPTPTVPVDMSYNCSKVCGKFSHIPNMEITLVIQPRRDFGSTPKPTPFRQAFFFFFFVLEVHEPSSNIF